MLYKGVELLRRRTNLKICFFRKLNFQKCHSEYSSDCYNMPAQQIQIDVYNPIACCAALAWVSG